MDILTRIVIDTTLDVEQRKIICPIGQLKRAVVLAPKLRFRDVLSRTGETNIIAEVKKASPSKGVFREDFDCEKLAAQYTEGGAAAISVLTERKYFLGSFANLERVSNASGLPCLCKDFIIDEYQIHEARIHGASAILLIAAILSRDKLRSFRETASELGMDSLVEIHDETELANALNSGADIIGVNARNLKDFAVSLETAKQLGAKIPEGIIRVAESGISSREEIITLNDSGYHAFLIGESLICSDDATRLLKELRGKT